MANNNKNGFTIIETAIAAAVLLFGVVGAYAAFSGALEITENIARRIEAVYLAQEGLEIARNIRDNNTLTSKTDSSIKWSEGLVSCREGCEMDYKTRRYDQIMPYKDRSLNINSEGFYGYGQGESAEFRRKITITSVSGSQDVLRVNAEIMWSSGGKPMTFQAQTYFYNWQ